MVESTTHHHSNAIVPYKTLYAPSSTVFEPIASWFETQCLGRHYRHPTSSPTNSSSGSAKDLSEVVDDEEEEDDSFLHALDPSDWKKHDHYAILGLRKKRINATPDEIKQCYRRKVLKHHPDKRRARGIFVKEGDDDYFPCITRAYEILSNPGRRRSYDSVDPTFDNSIPTKDAKFYKEFGAAFERNSRWSVKSNVPLLGDDSSSYDEVCKFYNFWYDFESWREYSYLDEEEKEKGENRDERKWIEKQNKIARAKLKKEEMARLRQLVDLAYSVDPRIKHFKEVDREKKLALKRAKQEAAKAKQEAEEREKTEAEEAKRLEKIRADELAQSQASELKRKKAEQKKLLKKEQKTLRAYAEKFNYFTSGEASSQRSTKIVADVEKLIENLSLERLACFNKNLSLADKMQAVDLFSKQLTEYNELKERERKDMMESLQKRSTGDVTSGGAKKNWLDEEVACLIKAVNLFPAGTIDRWEVVANFISNHVSGSSRSPKEVLAKAKDLQKNDMTLKTNASVKAFENFDKEKKAAKVSSAPSQRLETIADQQIRETGSNPSAWTGDEQKLLEQALKTFPTSAPERWEKIAEAVGTRSKKDCIKRYKELVELIKAKKAAQETIRSNKS